MQRVLLAVGGLVLVALVGWFLRPNPDDHPGVRVFAAASLAPILQDLQRTAAAPKPKLHFASSATLARQIMDGRPADVFLSAHRDWVDALVAADLVHASPSVFARNRLVCVAPSSDPLASEQLTHPRDLLALLESGDRIAIADQGVPLGRYTREALTHAGADLDLEGFHVGFPDALAVYRSVAQNQVRAGWTYASEASLPGVVILFEFPADWHAPIEYWGCVLRHSTDPEDAKRYLDQLMDPKAQDVFQHHAFQGI